MKCKEWIVSQNRKKILEQELLKALAMGDMVGVNKLFTWYAFNYEFNVWRNDNTFVTYALLKRGRNSRCGRSNRLCLQFPK